MSAPAMKIDTLVSRESCERLQVLARNAAAALRARYLNTWPENAFAYVFVHYLYGLTTDTLKGELPHRHVALLTQLASLEISAKTAEVALRTYPQDVPEHILAISEVVEGYGLRDSLLIKPTIPTITDEADGFPRPPPKGTTIGEDA